MMLIQKFSQLYEASDRLHRMGYYDEWPTDYYHEVVSSRQQQFAFLKEKICRAKRKALNGKRHDHDERWRNMKRGGGMAKKKMRRKKLKRKLKKKK